MIPAGPDDGKLVPFPAPVFPRSLYEKTCRFVKARRRDPPFPSRRADRRGSFAPARRGRTPRPTGIPHPWWEGPSPRAGREGPIFSAAAPSPRPAWSTGPVRAGYPPRNRQMSRSGGGPPPSAPISFDIPLKIPPGLHPSFPDRDPLARGRGAAAMRSSRTRRDCPMSSSRQATSLRFSIARSRSMVRALTREPRATCSP